MYAELYEDESELECFDCLEDAFDHVLDAAFGSKKEDAEVEMFADLSN